MMELNEVSIKQLFSLVDFMFSNLVICMHSYREMRNIYEHSLIQNQFILSNNVI